MEPDASEPLGPGATASAVMPSLWRRIVATGDEPEPRPPASTVAASWIRTAVSAAEAVTTCCPLGPQEAEQRAGEPALCASRSFTTRPFMAALPLWGFVCAPQPGPSVRSPSISSEVEGRTRVAAKKKNICSQKNKKKQKTEQISPSPKPLNPPRRS